MSKGGMYIGSPVVYEFSSASSSSSEPDLKRAALASSFTASRVLNKLPDSDDAASGPGLFHCKCDFTATKLDESISSLVDQTSPPIPRRHDAPMPHLQDVPIMLDDDELSASSSAYEAATPASARRPRKQGALYYMPSESALELTNTPGLGLLPDAESDGEGDGAKRVSRARSNSSSDLEGLDVLESYIGEVSPPLLRELVSSARVKAEKSDGHLRTFSEALLSRSAHVRELDRREKSRSDRQWNEEHLAISEAFSSARDEKALLLAMSRMQRLAGDFSHAATLYAQIIISEMYLPKESKTIAPVSVGGIAGGDKYIKNGILFKFALDVELRPGLYMYGGSAPRHDLAAKAAGRELNNRQQLHATFDANFHLPLMCLVDYLGHRLIASSLLPLGKDTLVYGSNDGGARVLSADAEMETSMRNALEFLGLGAHSVRGTRMYGPGDLEGHRGTDGRLYVIDVARLFPPEAPRADAPARAVFYRMLRPELVYAVKMQEEKDRKSARKASSSALKRSLKSSASHPRGAEKVEKLDRKKSTKKLERREEKKEEKKERKKGDSPRKPSSARDDDAKDYLLSSDAFTGWSLGDPDALAHESRVRAATNALYATHLPLFISSLRRSHAALSLVSFLQFPTSSASRGSPAFVELSALLADLSLPALAHAHGLNLRLLGAARALLSDTDEVERELRHLLLCACVARTYKNVMRAEMREALNLGMSHLQIREVIARVMTRILNDRYTVVRGEEKNNKEKCEEPKRGFFKGGDMAMGRAAAGEFPMFLLRAGFPGVEMAPGEVVDGRVVLAMWLPQVGVTLSGEAEGYVWACGGPGGGARLEEIDVVAYRPFVKEGFELCMSTGVLALSRAFTRAGASEELKRRHLLAAKAQFETALRSIPTSPFTLTQIAITCVELARLAETDMAKRGEAGDRAGVAKAREDMDRLFRIACEKFEAAMVVKLMPMTLVNYAAAMLWYGKAKGALGVEYAKVGEELMAKYEKMLRKQGSEGEECQILKNMAIENAKRSLKSDQVKE